MIVAPKGPYFLRPDSAISGFWAYPTNVKQTFALLFGLACTVAWGQDLDQKVEYRTVAVPLQKVVADLSTLTKLNIQVAPTMANEIVILGVKDMSLRMLLKRLGEVTTGRWEESPERMVLVRDTAGMRTQEDLEYRKRLTAVQNDIKKLVACLAPKKPTEKPKKTPEQEEWDPEMVNEMMGMINSDAPAGRALIKLIQGIGAAPFASLASGDRMVFATTPTRMQRSMPSGAPAIFDQLIRDHNAYVKSMPKGDPEQMEELDSEMTQRIQKFAERFGYGRENQTIDRPAVKAILSVEQEAFGGNLSVTMSLFDDKGNVMLNETGYLDTGDSGYMSSIMADIPIPGEKPKPEPKFPQEKPIEYSALTKARLEMRMNFMDPLAAPKMTPELREAMLNPERFDPLSFSESEALLATGAAKGWNIVANLPDGIAPAFNMEGMPGMPAKAALTPSRHLHALQNNGALKVIQVANELLVVPSAPAQARRTRLSRAALGRVLRIADQNGTLTLDDMAAYSLVALPPMETPVATQYFMTFAPSVMTGGMAGMMDWNLLRFYGMLAPDQRQALLGGARIPLGQLSQPQQAMATRLLFGAPVNLSVERPGEKKDDDDLEGLFGGFMGAFGGGAKTDYRDEPTELMPNGMPGNGYLQITAKKSNVVYSADKVPNMLSRYGLGVDELALFAMMKEDPNMQEAGGFIPSLTQVKLGERTTYDIRLQVADGVARRGTLQDDRLPKDATVINMSELPASFTAEIEKRKEKWKKLGLPFGGREQNGPPPAKR